MQLFDLILVTCLDVADLVLLHKLVNGAVPSTARFFWPRSTLGSWGLLDWQTSLCTLSREQNFLSLGILVRVQIEWKTPWLLRWTSFSISWFSRPKPCLTSHPTNQCVQPFLPFPHLAPISQSFHFLIIYIFIFTFFFYGSNYCYLLMAVFFV